MHSKYEVATVSNQILILKSEQRLDSKIISYYIAHFKPNSTKHRILYEYKALLLLHIRTQVVVAKKLLCIQVILLN